MGTTTVKRSLYKPDEGETLWGDEVNNNFDNLDDSINGIDVTLSGVTVLNEATGLNFVGGLSAVNAGGGIVTISGAVPSSGSQSGSTYITWDVATTSAGQNKSRTSGGTYTAHRSYIETYRPIKLYQVKWDVAVAKTYTLKIYRGWQITTALANLGDQTTAGQTAEVTWSAGNLFLPTGKYVLELTWTGAAVVDDNAANSTADDPLVFSFYHMARSQYNTTFDGAYSTAVKLVAYLGTTNLVA